MSQGSLLDGTFGWKHDRCRGCDRAIIWAVNESTGKPIPLDAVAPVYNIVGEELEKGTPVAGKAVNAFVSHFTTCKKPEQFSKGERP